MEKYYTVTALTKYIKLKFDSDPHLKKVFLKGEISNFKPHSRGHFYFTLKDEETQISAIMFASSAKKVTFKPEDGMSVYIEGNVSVFPVSGQYQVYVDSMEVSGLGDLHLQFEKLKKELQEEGLFDSSHKQNIPKFPKAVAVLTSPTGAAVRDVIHIINRRFPLTKIIVYPTLVQGPMAKDDIVKQIKKANNDQLVDTIILGRGGGSIEDLWPFNEEIVARAIYQSKIPIISSVGHETDFTISDFVADLRAPTPSGGAELVVPNQTDILYQIHQHQLRLSNLLSNVLKQKKYQYKQLKDSYILKNPLRLLEPSIHKVDRLTDKLDLLNPKEKIILMKQEVKRAQKQLLDYYQKILLSKQNDFTSNIQQLELLNPLNIMKKGYAVTKKDNKIIKSIAEIQVGDLLEIQLKDGSIMTKALEKKVG